MRSYHDRHVRSYADSTSESVHYRGKGAKDRRVQFGPKTARALSRYLRARDKHKGAELPYPRHAAGRVLTTD